MEFRISGEKVKICLQEISDKTLRLSLLPAGKSVREVFSTLDLADREWPEPSLSLGSLKNVKNDGVSKALRIGNFTVKLEGTPLQAAVYREGRFLQSLTFCETGEVTFPLGGGKLFGLGHGFKQQMDRRGGDYDLRTDGQIRGIQENYSAVSPTPYVINSEGWALYFHQPWKGEIDLRGEKGVFRKYMGAYCDVFIVDCADPMDAPKEYYAFTGLPPMPPKYAFGYQQSYRTLVYNGVNYVEKTARYMREHGIPCDMLIYLGSGYCEHGWNTYNGNFEWDQEAFPQPEETMENLHEMGYKISLHVTRCHHGLHGKISDEGVSPLEYDHAKNYWKRHEKLYSQAKNEAWWPDDADGVDMAQRLCRHRMYYEGSLKLNPDTRPLQMQRNTFPGANKWGGIIWSGDVLSEWETLKNQIPIGLNVALSSSPYWGTDTGGFFCTPEYDGELFLRWMEYSAFTPMFRGHGRPSFLHNPWGWSMFNSLDEIPLELAPGMTHDGPPPADALPDTRVEPLCKEIIRLRYSLLPYIYSLSHEACSGVPVMRPLWCYYPHDEQAVATDSEYFFGKSLLVAPVTKKGSESWEVYLPQGKWYHYWTGKAYEGGRDYTVPAPLGKIPLFVPAGGILAKTPVVQHVNTEKREDFEPLTLDIYTGADGEYELYEDDGISLGYQRGECTKTYLRWDEETKKLSASGVSSLFPGREREIEIRFMPEGRLEKSTLRYEPIV